jgi:hypothetical protein
MSDWTRFAEKTREWLSRPALDELQEQAASILASDVVVVAVVLAAGLAVWMMPNLTKYRVKGQSSAAKPAALTVVLIHGTWGRGFFLKLLTGEPATWVTGKHRDFCRLRNRLEQLLVDRDVQYRYFNWSGRNTTFARRSAAMRLASELEALAGATGGKLLLIGHSHGGTVACRALDALEQPTRDHIAGVVCLSTPFFHFFYRDVRGLLGRWVLALLSALAVIAPIAIIEAGLSAPARMAHVVAATVALMLGGGLLSARRLRAQARRLAQKYTFHHLKSEETLLIRASGDEASLALITSQAVAWVSQASLRAVEKAARSMGCLVVLLALGVLALTGVVDLTIADDIPGLAPRTSRLITVALLVVMLPVLVVGIGASLLALLVVALVPTLGTLGALLSPFLDVAVEAAPVGKWTVHYVKPPSSGLDLDHSSYNNDEALDVLDNWLQPRLRALGL